MISSQITILLLGDTHLGFDLSLHPRIQVRRRGEDFFANYQHVLETALEENVDLVIHGGDMFFRSRVPGTIIERAYEPLLKVANAGIPIYLVPGNHERSRLPAHLFLSHENIHIFDQPRTFTLKVCGSIIAMAGFPFVRKVNPNFSNLLQQTRHLEVQADLRFLCLHQAFEGATVGPNDFTFRADTDTLSSTQIPAGFTAVLSGHIHRSQSLTRMTGQSSFPIPVIYPGSIERTSFAERFEEKHFVLLRVDPVDLHLNVDFKKLPARPMHRIQIPTRELSAVVIRERIKLALSDLDPDSIVHIQLTTPDDQPAYTGLSAGELRSLAPPTMNISLVYNWKQSDPKPNSSPLA